MLVSLAIVVLLSAPFLYVVARKQILRRLALRNAARRPKEALLVVVGALMGAAIITGSAIVGDSINASVRQIARQHLGPVDELVLTRDATAWRTASSRLALLDPDVVDGVMPIATIGASTVNAD